LKEALELSKSILFDENEEDVTQQELLSPVLQMFSRGNLDATFGPGFSSKGMKKHGETTDEIYQLSQAVQSGVVLLKKDGTIDKRSEAVKRGEILFKENGKIDITKSKLFQEKHIRTNSTAACHIVSFEVVDAVYQQSNFLLNKETAESDNLYLKSTQGNINGTFYMEGQGDRALDAEIKNAIAGVGRGKLSEKAANRAKRQISIILNSKDEIPLEIIESFRELYNRLEDQNGHKICRANAKISALEPSQSRLSTSMELRNRKQSSPTPSRAESGLKNDGEPDLRTTVGKQRAAAAAPPSTFLLSGSFDTPPRQLTTISRAQNSSFHQPSYSSSSFSGTFSGRYHSTSGSANGPRGGQYYMNSNGNKTYI
jgi:hypothetical protein